MNHQDRFQSGSMGSLDFAKEILQKELPLGIFDDYVQANPSVTYKAWIMTNHYVNLWSAQFTELTRNEPFAFIEVLFYKSLFTKAKVAVYYDDDTFKLFTIIHDDPEQPTVTCRQFDATSRIYPEVKFSREDVLIVSDGFAFDRWTYAFLTNLEIAKLYDVTFTTTLAESKKWKVTLNSTDPAYLEAFWKRFLNNEPWISVDSITTTKDLPNSVETMDLGTPTAPGLFQQLLNFQAFHAEMLGVTQATDTKAERLTAGENVINVNNINLINALLLKSLNLFARQVSNKWGVDLEFGLATTLTPKLMDEPNPLINESEDPDDAIEVQ